MENSAISFGEFILVLAAGAILAFLFVVIRKVLTEASFFKGATSVVVALCVSLLLVIALYRFLLPASKGWELAGKSGRFGIGLDFILLPYAALAIAILLMSLLLFLNNIFRKRDRKRYYREFYRGAERAYPLERKDKPFGGSDEETHIRQ